MFLDERVICPSCGAQRVLRSFRLCNETLEIAKLASRFGRNWDWAREYVSSFQSEIDKPLKPARMLLVLKEVWEFVEKKGFTYNRQWHSIRPDVLFGAIRLVALKNMLGLKNHNYLKKVAIALNEQAVEKEEREVVKKEEELMIRHAVDPRGPERIKEIMKRLDSGSSPE